MFDKLWEWLNQPTIEAKIRLIGDNLRWSIAAVALLAAANFQPETFWPAALAILVAQLIVDVLKRVMNFTPWGRRPDGHDSGFPSGHVAGAFSGAWYFYFVFGFGVALIPLILGCFTALSRVLPEKHSWLQVSVSAILTFFVSQYFLT